MVVVVVVVVMVVVVVVAVVGWEKIYTRKNILVFNLEF